MPEVAQEIRRRILNSLEAAQSAVLTERNSTKIPTGYQNFELILTALAGCRHSIERMLDQQQIIEILRGASNTLCLWEAGLTEVVVRSARLAINEVMSDLGCEEADPGVVTTDCIEKATAMPRGRRHRALNQMTIFNLSGAGDGPAAAANSPSLVKTKRAARRR